MAGRILSEADASAQIELDSGKRVEGQGRQHPAQVRQARPPSCWPRRKPWPPSIELDLAWEFAPEDDFGFADIARDYFSRRPRWPSRPAMLLAAVRGAALLPPRGQGPLQESPAEILQQALAAIEKKKQLQAQIDAWAAGPGQQANARRPSASSSTKSCFKPDKNAPEYKAVVEASRQRTARAAGAAAAGGRHRLGLPVPLEALPVRELSQGHGLSAAASAQPPDDLPLADVQAYSIDDSQTTEIDDALSVKAWAPGTVAVGIHIAAPGLAIPPGSELDKLGRDRLSTVYMPGYKITMLPDEVVQIYTLDEGRANPAVSLYVTYDEATLEVTEQDHAAWSACPWPLNLRHDQLDHIVTASLAGQPSDSARKHAPSTCWTCASSSHFCTAWRST